MPTWIDANQHSPNKDGSYHTNLGLTDWGNSGNADDFEKYWLNRHGGHVTKWLDESEESNQDELWDEMYVSLDSMAVDIDPYEYGLPSYDPKRQSIIDELKLRYLLIRK